MNLQVDYLRKQESAPSVAEVTAIPLSRVQERVDETAHRFGDGLIGVISHAVAGTAPRINTSRIGVVLLNAGLTRHVGPYRAYAELARRLAREGYPVLRFDQSGLGDSALPEQAAAGHRSREIDAAMSLLAEHAGAERFVLCGLCSGADDAFHVAAADHRVAGAILLDGLAYPTQGFWLRHALPRLLSPTKVIAYLRSRRNAGPSLADFRDFPAKADAARMLSDMVARDTRLLFVFTGGAYTYFNHRSQLAACLGRAARSPQVSLEYWREYDHTFYLRKHREMLFARISHWMATMWGQPAGSSREIAST
ncbi:alpha/beta hydrolase [Lysobacter arenosi]|uniref:Alpha/beta hydrolase n=1 Tax=Lysobacter arenosi TaxID=2795387 RepID=A0ABX7RCP3_9GAMM|nr:alpha/beta fold hydrolase [Lysobacter arenosi]QSX75475.1 alpha/beta hydrolase [Lysobacter arenosi]